MIMYYLNYYYDENSQKTFYKVVYDYLTYTNKWTLLATYVYNEDIKKYQTKEEYAKYCHEFVRKKYGGSKFKKFLKFIIDL